MGKIVHYKDRIRRIRSLQKERIRQIQSFSIRSVKDGIGGFVY